ncbi:hypothetical protein LMG23992_04247 [Cupriavidus laharis]|uniref:Uncharacterized protein n=1 Tax=Cupriavidus laharis TaxID=151654 RepID=A0ABM8XK75_9BURK|nr:hypothetical protein [Cupriavidus laharis]CAG9180458.1 hypothetical protein LMG23992_04247 [Cupriavidus laharis]
MSELQTTIAPPFGYLYHDTVHCADCTKTKFRRQAYGRPKDGNGVPFAPFTGDFSGFKSLYPTRDAADWQGCTCDDCGRLLATGQDC